MTKTFHSLEDLRAAVGDNLGSSRWFELTQDRIDLFAELTEDHQWIHVDPVRAAKGPFGATVAHGYLTLSLVASMLGDVMANPWATSGVNYGLNRVRFPAPAQVGSRIRGNVELQAADDISGGLQIVTKVVVEREGFERPVCVAEAVGRLMI